MTNQNTHHAEAILRAAGSSLRHYDPRTREAILAAVREAVGEWLPIEQAPKDGMPILTCRMGESVSWFNYTTVGGYAEPPEAAYWDEHTERFQPFQRPHDEWNPTHWLPLPTPPRGE